MSIRVISQRAGGTSYKAGEVLIRIDRSTVLGNPFPMAHESQRNAVVQQYRVWLNDQRMANTHVWQKVTELAARAKSGTPLALQCWCAPKACHGDVIKAAIEYLNK